MARVVSLTTSNNPFDPIEQFDEWYAYDLSLGQDTAGFLARIAKITDELPPAYYDAAIEEAIDEIVKYNVTGNYVKIVRDVDD